MTLYKPNVIHLQMQDDDVQTTMAWQEQQVVKFSSEETPATMYEMANFDLLVLYNPPHWTATTRQIVGGSTVCGKQQIQDWLRDITTKTGCKSTTESNEYITYIYIYTSICIVPMACCVEKGCAYVLPAICAMLPFLFDIF